MLLRHALEARRQEGIAPYPVKLGRISGWCLLHTEARGSVCGNIHPARPDASRPHLPRPCVSYTRSDQGHRSVGYLEDCPQMSTGVCIPERGCNEENGTYAAVQRKA